MKSLKNRIAALENNLMAIHLELEDVKKKNEKLEKQNRFLEKEQDRLMDELLEKSVEIGSVNTRLVIGCSICLLIMLVMMLILNDVSYYAFLHSTL